MSELTKEYVEDYELNYGCGNEDWELFSEELIDYSEGSTTTQYVYKNKEDGELWAFNTKLIAGLNIMSSTTPIVLKLAK